ncbi:HEPN domain-containing protein [Spirosoma taeanense]|uniref:HEPN domain-containing protein n=1 Tax=Spirosoma taeanense TaxID=2735870 RepID=A0A6M5YF95_9BACT|nr:HEPN domain-containing protein [Spirosoma taeanense]QJW91976.1 HEPN domain-containing protein [Spirosoma taeanense]
MSRTKDDLISYRVERAYGTLQTAKKLAESGDWNGVANRLYYACFYAVLALLAKNDMDTYTHKGVKSMLNQHFIKSGLVDVVWGKIYQKLFDNRNEADYEDFIDFDEEKIGAFVEDAENFIKLITSLAKQ